MRRTVRRNDAALTLAVAAKSYERISADCSYNLCLGLSDSFIITQNLRPICGNLLQYGVVGYCNGANPLTMLHAVIYSKNLYGQNILNCCVMPFTLCIHAGEGQITAYHKQCSALFHVLADKIAAVRHLGATRKCGVGSSRVLAPMSDRITKSYLISSSMVKGKLLAAR